MLRSFFFAVTAIIFVSGGFVVSGANPSEAQAIDQTKGEFEDKFRQLEEVWPTPNVYRTGSGAPGHRYWQQQADYVMKIALDEDKKRITGSANITYTNNSPDALRYIWLQMDQNRFAKHSDGYKTRTNADAERMSMRALRSMELFEDHDGGFKIGKVVDGDGRALSHKIVDTVMRIDLPSPLQAGQTMAFSIEWSYAIVEGRAMGARGGWEAYDDDNLIFFISQFYPRLSAYTDAEGWNTKQFLGSGEFTLEFGDYDVEITVPADHVVASTGVLQNPRDVLTAAQRQRLKEAETAKRPVFVVTADEALANEKEGTSKTRTWHFKADNVRDFAFAASRKFVWDAMGYQKRDGSGTVMAMSFYPNEGMPLWDKFSTQAIVHTLDTYSKYTFEYPYPVAQSILGPLGGGMEYPMITSNGPKPEIAEDGTKTYTRRAKYFLIGVVIHEIGHNWFPMIVDSDERNWTWMDEGLNSFLQTLSEREWEENYPGRRINPKGMIPYMISTNQVPIMTQSDSILQFGNNAYGKPAAALNILRETVMGRDLFDFAFKEYSNRWKFKRPYPADFFRTMEDASGLDLDWFWRGWFYTTDHVDIGISRVTLATVDTKDPDVEEPWKRDEEADEPNWPGEVPRDDFKYRVAQYPELLDFYNENDKFTVTGKLRKKYGKALKDLEDWEKDILGFSEFIYFVEFENKGGLVMPLVLEIEYADGEVEERRIPAEIWRRNAKSVTKPIISDREIVRITLDPHWETADADDYNNHWPPKAAKSRLELFKDKKRRDLMKEAQDDAKAAAEKNKKGDGEDKKDK